ncbi:hypothetical protein K2X33_04760 [bacterium]|nr:hypothetical protein [bacterium]
MFKIRSRKPVPGTVSNEGICAAIRGKFQVECVYVAGEPRLIEPHCHGHSHQGHEVLSAFQVGEGWKMFDVSKIVSFEIRTDVFSIRPDFNPAHPGMTQIHCCAE